MDDNKILKSDFIDILFEGRNKEYGAYELRKNYGRRMSKSTLIGVGAICFILFGYSFASKNLNITKKKVLKEYNLAEPPPIDENVPPPPPPPPVPPPPVQATVKFVPPVIKKDNEIKESEAPDNKKIDDAKIDNKNQEGNKDDGDLGEAKFTPPPVVPNEPDNKVYDIVEQEAEYPGGDEALLNFLAENINYPNAAKDAGIEGMVSVKFVVNADGTVSNVSVLKGIGYGCDQEAVRVIKMLKRFKPGKQNGNPVRCYYNVPVRFVLQ